MSLAISWENQIATAILPACSFVNFQLVSSCKLVDVIILTMHWQLCGFVKKRLEQGKNYLVRLVG